MPLEILILCHSFIVTGGKAVRISLLCLLGFGVFWDGVEVCTDSRSDETKNTNGMSSACSNT